MADSERFSAPGCWAACTTFSRTRKGILLLAEIATKLALARVEKLTEHLILCLVILICFSAGTSGYSSLSVVEMVLAIVFFVIYMCDLHTRAPFINWPWSDFFRTLIAAILYLITSIFVLVERGNHSKIAAGMFICYTGLSLAPRRDLSERSWVSSLPASLAMMPTLPSLFGSRDIQQPPLIPLMARCRLTCPHVSLQPEDDFSMEITPTTTRTPNLVSPSSWAWPLFWVCLSPPSFCGTQKETPVLPGPVPPPKPQIEGGGHLRFLSPGPRF